MSENIKAAFDFAELHLQSTEQLTVEHDGVKANVLVLHGKDGARVVEVKQFVDPMRMHPMRRVGTLSVDDLESFIFLVNRDKRPNTVVFAGRGAKGEPYLVAVLDFHEAGATTPHFCEDRVRYGFPVSDEWKAWTAKHGEANAMRQGPFAQFIEDHIFDVGEPAAAGNIAQAFASKLGVSFAGPQALMAVSRGLEVRSESRVKEVRNLENGDTSLVFETAETDKNGGPLSIPSAFHVLIPIFKGGATYSIPVRLRRRSNGGSLLWWLELHRSDLFLDDALLDALAKVRAAPSKADATGGCGLPVVMGTPP